MTQIDELRDAASQAQKQQASVVGRLNEELTNARKAAQQAQTELAAHELQLQETQRALTAKEDERTMLSAQAQLLEEALVEQTAALGEEARAESRQLAALIDDVQRGGSWKLKSVLTRLKSFLRA
ncbi:MAG: hypothetical protein JOZ59_02690 [Candidatus Eremiobacteraeota bacterium]|nr:hypothetical protein [Candidatus Eremiobacteraeota bacterium]